MAFTHRNRQVSLKEQEEALKQQLATCIEELGKRPYFTHAKSTPQTRHIEQGIKDLPRSIFSGNNPSAYHDRFLEIGNKLAKLLTQLLARCESPSIYIINTTIDALKELQLYDLGWQLVQAAINKRPRAGI